MLLMICKCCFLKIYFTDDDMDIRIISCWMCLSTDLAENILRPIIPFTGAALNLLKVTR
jgi:hypothetical protein